MKDKEGHGSEAQDKAEHHGRWNMESGKEGGYEASTARSGRDAWSDALIRRMSGVKNKS